MFLLVPAHPGCPGQIAQSRKMVVLCVCVCVQRPGSFVSRDQYVVAKPDINSGCSRSGSVSAEITDYF